MTIQTHNGLVGDPSSLAESILEHIADAVIYADGTGAIRRWNTSAADLFGYGPGEALGQSLDLIIPERQLLADLDVPPAADHQGRPAA